MHDMEKPFVIEHTAQNSWRSHYTFDTTDDGRLEPLRQFVFELRAEPGGKRPYRLYLDDAPCLGAQWQRDEKTALHSIEHFVGSYAYHRRIVVYLRQRERLEDEA